MPPRKPPVQTVARVAEATLVWHVTCSHCPVWLCRCRDQDYAGRIAAQHNETRHGHTARVERVDTTEREEPRG